MLFSAVLLTKSQIWDFLPKGTKVPNSVLRALTMFPKELHHLTATPAKPKSDDNVLSLPPLPEVLHLLLLAQ